METADVLVSAWCPPACKGKRALECAGAAGTREVDLLCHEADKYNQPILLTEPGHTLWDAWYDQQQHREEG